VVEVVLQEINSRAETSTVKNYINSKGENGYTALHHAASIGNASLVETLLKYGADPSIKDSDGNVPLHLTCQCKNCTNMST